MRHSLQQLVAKKRLSKSVILSDGPPSYSEPYEGKQREKAGREGGEGGGYDTHGPEMARVPLKLRSLSGILSPLTFNPVVLIHLPSLYTHLMKDAGMTNGRVSLFPRPRPLAIKHAQRWLLASPACTP